MPETLTKPKRPQVGGRQAEYDLDRMAALARAEYARAGRWPTSNGAIRPAADIPTWKTFDNYLGRRGSSLAQFLDGRFLAERTAGPPLGDDAIVALAVAHHQATGDWPTARTPDAVAGGDTWVAIDSRLRKRGSSLARLLDAHFPRPPRGRAPRPRLEPAPTDSELAALIAGRPRPEHRNGPANVGARDHEVDHPDVHGWWAVPDSRSLEERARARAATGRPGPRYAGTPVAADAEHEAGRRGRKLACRRLIEEFRRVRRRHRRLARVGGWGVADAE